MKSLNILIVCEHASSVFGGEAMLPLNYFRYLSKSAHQVYLITHERTKEVLAKIADIDQSKVFYIPDTVLHKTLFKLSSLLPDRLSILTFGFLLHLVTQFYQWKIARQLVKTKNIDLIHEPAPVSAVQPSMMFALGVPVVIGPMNGGMHFPPAFSHMASKVERCSYGLMRLFTSIYNLIIPGKFFADYLLVANERTRQALPRLRLGKVVEIVENGVFTVAEKPKTPQARPITEVIFVGRLVDWKAVDIAIDAIANCNQNIRLSILGDGQDRHALEEYANKIAPNKVRFLGQVPHAKINEYYDDADIFVLPSLRECGGAVVLEAMSRGLPVIATNWGGPADYISKDSGFLVDAKSRDYLVQEFSKKIDLLAADPSLREKIGLAAIHRTKTHFTWENKVDQIVEIYQKMVS